MTESKKHILVVDDDDSLREVLRFHLIEDGYDVDVASSGQGALSLFQERLHPVVMTDLKMPGMNGVELMGNIHKRAAETAVIVITAFGDIETAVGAMRDGAFDFIPKPTGRDHLRLVVSRAFEHISLKREVKRLRSQRVTGNGNIIFRSPKMERVVDMADRIASSDASVLITGESGTGKEIFAKRIHEKSDRAGSPFVPINCAAIPKDLLESELFGHVKGAFTGATKDRFGKFRQASGGTLFLDEIGELPLELQPRLLRALQERTIDAVGSEKSIPVDVRVVTATNRNLRAEVENGRFREDLFFRLNVVPIAIPPLRERKEDIPILFDYFVNHYSAGKNPELTQEFLFALEAYNWPGNVRELENLCHRLTLLSAGQELSPDLAPKHNGFRANDSSESTGAIQVSIPEEGMALEEIEKYIIEQALRLNGANQSKTARFLQIPRHVLLYRLEKFHIKTNGTP